MTEPKRQAELARESFEPLADFYAQSKAHTDKESLERVKELAEVSQEKLVLDIATGPGHTAMFLAPHVEWAVGLDLTRSMLLKAAELSSLRHIENLALVQGDVYSLPFNEETFDIVTCRRAPHHFPDLPRAIISMKGMIKRGGALVIDDRSVPEDDFADRLMNHLDVLHDRSHVRDYRPSEWKAAMDDAGLTVEVMESFHRVWPLSSLTETARPEDRKEIEHTINSLDEEGKRRMGVCEIEGVTHIRHWFIRIRARKS